MNVFQQERESIAGKLTAGGVANVTLDPRGQLPCVLVGLPAMFGGAGVGGWDCEFTVEILTPPPGDADAAAWLLDQLELVLATLGGGEAAPTTVTRNDQDVPAYVVRLPVSLTSPNC